MGDNDHFVSTIDEFLIVNCASVRNHGARRVEVARDQSGALTEDSW